MRKQQACISFGNVWLQGFFYAPTVLSNATIDMKIFREETFGPAIPLFRFHDDEEAIQLANNTEYGLAAYFFTKVPLLSILLNSRVTLDAGLWQSRRIVTPDITHKRA